MVQIRRNTFETNSSSTHAFSYVKDRNDNIDFENLELYIKPFMHSEDSSIKYPIHEFTTVEDKLRYFFTLYCKHRSEDSTCYLQSECEKFMNIIFNIFPKVTFDLKKYGYEDLMYFEDDNYVFSDFFAEPDELWMKIHDADTMKKFFNKGIIYFGDRDAGNYYYDPWDDVWNYNEKIDKITSVSG